MYRFIALLVSAGVGGIAAWQVYINLDTIVKKWLITLGFSAGTFLLVTLVLYLPLFRHIADLIEEQFSTLNARFTARKTGLGLDEVPQQNYRRHTTSSSHRALCSMCGGPGGPICEKCADRMSKK
ncbi:MAG: hypothetical protein JXX29_13460 [Deltaproteobacteria bacterium]|nr:hypothetical protein [Deltaproteobacteria bacterium]MBN2672686.1 hypothetical protein [Deltaproteobacteria bacterium]